MEQRLVVRPDPGSLHSIAIIVNAVLRFSDKLSLVGKEPVLDLKYEIIMSLDEVMNLNGRAAAFTLDSPLLGAIPELDSIAIVALLATLEERFGFEADDVELDGSLFATLGSLVDFVQRKVGVPGRQ